MDTVRQLEYVAVSRATDTATVITDMAKVEDSPLNHEANQFSKTDEHKSSVNPNDNTINPVIQRSENEITKQIVGHLKSIPGIKVFGRNAMEKFLKTHNIAGLQQMENNNSQINKKENDKNGKQDSSKAKGLSLQRLLLAKRSKSERSILEAANLFQGRSNGAYENSKGRIGGILLHNHLFGDITKLSDIGFGRDSDGTFKIIVAQSYINGTFATHEEILDYAKKRGFITENGNTYYYKGIKINDLNPLNVLKTPNEGYAVVDAELRFTGIMQEDSIGNSVETFTT